jgi:DNA mismatch repair protein MSH6
VERESAKALQTAQSDTNTWDAQRTLRELSSGYFQQHDSMEVCESDDGNQNWPPVLQQVATTFHDQDSTDAASGADLTLRAVGACVSYLKQQLVDREMVALKNFHAFVPYDNPSSGPTASRHITGHAEELHMVLDTNSIANLELLVSELGEKEGSLLGLLDRCHTPAGHRLLKNWLLSPLYQREAINARLDAVTELVDIRNIRDKAATTFAKLPDFERLLNRIHSTGECCQARHLFCSAATNVQCCEKDYW